MSASSSQPMESASLQASDIFRAGHPRQFGQSLPNEVRRDILMDGVMYN
jgi:hypothetical protein